MSQPSVAAFFGNRKRAAASDTAVKKTKILIDADKFINLDVTHPPPSKPTLNQEQNDIVPNKTLTADRQTRSGRCVKRIGVQQMSTESIEPKQKNVCNAERNIKQQKLVQFIKKGSLSPMKKKLITTPAKHQGHEVGEAYINKVEKGFDSSNNETNVDRNMKTPTKQIIKASIGQMELKSLVKKELSFDEVKSKVSRSAKLQELKASLARIQELEKSRKNQEEHNKQLRESGPLLTRKTPAVQLKEFDTIELEVYSSPSKLFKTPTKLPPPTPDKNELMSPRHTEISKRVLFSPSKNGSPSKMLMTPAYLRFMNLAETQKAGHLPLPYKYRNLLEIFKGVDSVCAMFHNRNECITFKKLKPAVQRMLRKNFCESHLAQIKQIFPEAFIFSQMKTRNYGSTSKADYHQLIINPNVAQQELDKEEIEKFTDDDVLDSANFRAMNPHVMTYRMQRFQNLLLARVKEEHDKFLKSLDPPLFITKDKVTRWHPDFDLENCSEIEKAQLPQPPNVEKYSSARDILSTARNLFDCATPMERAMNRYKAKLEAERTEGKDVQLNAENSQKESTYEENTIIQGKIISNEPVADFVTAAPTVPKPLPSVPNVSKNLLKGLPSSLIEKIRAKQAAKALDSMTRRPSQDEEAVRYARLPELARHLRNIFVAERKGVLMLEVVIKKIQNSFRTSLSSQEIEMHLKLIAKELPAWITFHEVRKSMYLKISKDMDMVQNIALLEKIANDKSK